MNAHARSIFLITLSHLMLTPVASASPESSDSNNPENTRQSPSPSVYKTIDRYGRISYSWSIPQNAVEVEEVEIAPGPSQSNIEEYRLQQQRIADTARKFDEARVQREAAREEAEKKRLERQALLNAARQKQPDHTHDRNLYIGRPWKPWWGWSGGPHHGHRHHKHDRHPEHKRKQPYLPLPPSSFPDYRYKTGR